MELDNRDLSNPYFINWFRQFETLGNLLVIGSLRTAILEDIARNYEKVVIVNNEGQPLPNQMKNKINVISLNQFKDHNIPELQFNTVIIMSEYLSEFSNTINKTNTYGSIIIISELNHYYSALTLARMYELETVDISLIDLYKDNDLDAVIYKKLKNEVPGAIDIELLKKWEDFYIKNENSVMNQLLRKYRNEKIEKVKAYNDLRNHLIEEKSAVKKVDKLYRENQALRKKLDNLERKYSNLRKSKLGRVITKYWEIRRGLRRS